MLPYAPDAWYRTASVKTGYEISFNRYFYKPEPMRSLDEIRADIVALERESEGLLQYLTGELMVREPRASYRAKPRIYVDTSVIGGCEDEEFREASQRLMEQFRDGRATLVLSELTLGELAGVPSAPRAILDAVPRENREMAEESDAATALAGAYLDAGVLPASSRSDALHVAIAKLAGVDVIASWNFRHMVNWHRIQEYNAVNRARGHGSIDIRRPGALQDES